MSQARLLVVEDERIFALDLKQRLQSMNFEVVGTVARGADAIRAAEERRPDLVLMDIHLEGPMDGITAAQTINEQFKIPVIFLTAYAEDDILNRAQNALAYGYLVKPCDTRELGATLRIALARRQAELAVEHNEARLRLALEAADMSAWEWDSELRRFSASGAIDAIFGRAAELLREQPDQLLARLDNEGRAAVTRALDTGTPIAGCFRFVRQNESMGWLELLARPVGAVTGRERLVGVMKDVTERREMEERLRQASVVFDTTAEGILITDEHRRILSVNPAFQVITGFTSEQMLGRDPDEVFHVRRHSPQFYERLITSPGRQWQGEVLCRRDTGELFPGWEQVSLVVEDDAVSHIVFAVSDLSAVRRAEAQLNYLAHHDPLTGLPNRLLLNERVEQQVYYSRRQGVGFAMAFIDLDDFKLINDTLGHDYGDELLKVIAGRLRTVLRRSDTVARLGGDEFILLVADVMEPEACAGLAQKILTLVTQPVLLNEVSVQVSASLGLAFFPSDGEDAQQLFKAADSAMYYAKGRGRNQFSFYSRDMAAQAEQRLALEQGLRQAIELNQLEVHYQPIVNLADGSFRGAEALLRWNHPQQGMIPPGRFIPVAEGCGLIDALGAWVLRQACRDASAWSISGEWRVSVNVSVRQFMRGDLHQVVKDVLTATALPSSRLELEITESAIQNADESRNLLTKLQALGVALAVDDFGTGYSCLSVLKQLPIDRLKIDRSFVADLPGDASSAALATAILAMGKGLSLAVTAEGIETEDQRQYLQSLGCEQAQGYLFARPMPVANLRQWMTKHVGDTCGEHDVLQQ